MIYISPENREKPHGPYTGYPGVYEHDVCTEIGELAAKELQRCGFEVKLAAPGSTMAQRASEANRMKADLYLTVHTNAGASSGRSGSATPRLSGDASSGRSGSATPRLSGDASSGRSGSATPRLSGDASSGRSGSATPRLSGDASSGRSGSATPRLSGDGGTGAEVYYYNHPASIQACQLVYNELVKLYPSRRGIKDGTKGYYEIYATEMVSVYPELGFHDNPQDAAFIVGHKQELAAALCQGICAYFGIGSRS